VRAAEAPSHAGGHNLLGAVALQHHGALPAWERPSVCSSSGGRRVSQVSKFSISSFPGSRAVGRWFVLVQDESADSVTGAR